MKWYDFVGLSDAVLFYLIGRTTETTGAWVSETTEATDSDKTTGKTFIRCCV